MGSRLQNVFASEPLQEFEVVVVENGSVDSTWKLLLEARAEDSRFKILQLSRNFDADGAATAGLSFASGDACVIMLADFQEPPEPIPSLLRKWEEGYEIGFGLVVRRGGTGLVRRFNSQIFYKLTLRLTGNAVTRNASDFRLVDKKVYKAVLGLDEKSRFGRELFSWVGFNSVGVPFERAPRFGGQSRAHTKTVLASAVRGFSPTLLHFSEGSLREEKWPLSGIQKIGRILLCDLLTG